MVFSSQIFCLTQNVLNEIRNSISIRTVECGGILGSNRSGEICRYYFDEKGYSDLHQYIPHVESINTVISVWEREQISFCGFAHSHAPDIPKLSEADYQYAYDILISNPSLRKIIMILIVPDSRKEIIYYSAEIILPSGVRSPVKIKII